MRRSLVFTLLFAAPLLTQNMGDYVTAATVRGTTYLLAADSSGAVVTLITQPGFTAMAGPVMAPGNGAGIVAGRAGTTGRLQFLQFQPTGQVATLATLPGTFTGLAALYVDRGSDLFFLVSAGGDRGVFRMSSGGGPFTTVAANSRGASFLFPFAMTEDLRSGDLLVFDINRKLYRIDLFGNVTTVTYTLPPSLTVAVTGGAHPDPSTGRVLVAYTSFLLGVDPATGATTTLFQPTLGGRLNFFGADYDFFRGAFALTWQRLSPLPATMAIGRFDPTQGKLTTIATLPQGTLTDALVWHSAPFGGVTRPRRGTAYQLQLSLPSEPGQNYLAGASFGFRPGIPVGNRVIPLNPDPLFFLSQLGLGVFVNFQGRLNGAGSALLVVNLPAALPVGLRFYLAAATYDQSGLRVITEPFGVTVEP